MAATLAIVLFGQLRTFKNKSIGDSYRHFLTVYRRIDLYIVCWNKRGVSAGDGRVNQEEKLKQDENITPQEVKDHFQQFSFFNIVSVQLLDFEQEMTLWTQDHRNIYHTVFNWNQVTTSVPVEYIIQRASRAVLPFSTGYRQIYFIRPDSIIIHPFDFMPDTILQDKVLYFNTRCDRCIDHGFYMNGVTLTALVDLFDRYIENMKNCRESDLTVFPHLQDTRDNNHLIAFHLKSKGIALSHKAVTIFAIAR